MKKDRARKLQVRRSKKGDLILSAVKKLNEGKRAKLREILGAKGDEGRGSRFLTTRGHTSNCPKISCRGE